MIKEEQIEVSFNSMSAKHYDSLGYIFERKHGYKFYVSSNDIPSGSGAFITRVCDKCNEEHEMRRSKYRPICLKCNSGELQKLQADRSKTTCPNCNGRKGYRAEVCRKCMNIGKDSSGRWVRNDKHIISHSQWAKEVKDLNGRVCNICSYSNSLALDAHHLNSHSLFPEQRHIVTNGVVLCKNCHVVFHKIHGNETTVEQYTKFKEAYNG